MAARTSARRLTGKGRCGAKRGGLQIARRRFDSCLLSSHAILPLARHLVRKKAQPRYPPGERRRGPSHVDDLLGSGRFWSLVPQPRVACRPAYRAHCPSTEDALVEDRPTDVKAGARQCPPCLFLCGRMWKHASPSRLPGDSRRASWNGDRACKSPKQPRPSPPTQPLRARR